MMLFVWSLLACKTLAQKKKNTELVDILMVSCGVKAATSLGELLSTVDTLEYRENGVPWKKNKKTFFFPINFLKNNKGLLFNNTIMIDQFSNKDGHNMLQSN